MHLYSLRYIYDFALRPDLVAPALWTLCWVIWWRLSRELPNLKPVWRDALSALPLLATLFATPQPQKAVFLALTGLNVALYGVIYRRYRSRVTLHLALISLVALLGGLPENWGQILTAHFTREKFLAGAVALYVLACASLVRNPKLGILGAMVAAGLVGAWTQPRPDTFHWAAQASLVYLLLHSLRWVDAEEQGAVVVRWLAGFGWVLHSLMWAHLDGGGWRAFAFAAVVLAVLLARRFWRHTWGPTAVLLAAVLVLLAEPSHLAAAQLKAAPAGLLAVLGSFLLFGLGTLGAATKHRWGAAASSQAGVAGEK